MCVIDTNRLFFVIAVFLSTVNIAFSQNRAKDNFNKFIQDLELNIPKANSGVYREPQMEDFKAWESILKLFQSKSYDSCRIILARYNYELLQIKDSITESWYDIIREKTPINYGWGTYVFNRNFKKRLYIHVNHPLDDPHALLLGSELFRQLRAEWLFIAGTSRRAVTTNSIADVGRNKKTIFHYLHEKLSDLTHVAISLHSYDENSYQYPISVTDIIISNGRTTDNQWGISQLSLSVRDTLRDAGYACGLAMYDSGYARLAGGWNVQGMFSNDSVGFGHWLYVELSNKVRTRPWEYKKLFAAFDRALLITEKKISHQVDRGFGLVSPRVIKVDSMRQLFFPSEDSKVYRIISYDAQTKQRDTIDIKLGNWLESINTKGTLTTLSVLDTTKDNLQIPILQSKRGAKISKVIEIPKVSLPITKVKRQNMSDSVSSDSDEDQVVEPLQVHRIPLKPIIDHTISKELQTELSPHQWQGVIKGWFVPDITHFDLNFSVVNVDKEEKQSVFFIPIINKSFQVSQTKFLGIEMTELLLSEIGRLVSEYGVAQQDLGLVAEESESGGFFLRIFPGYQPDAKKRRKN